MTRLAVSILVNDREQARSAAALAAERGADLVEYRLDQFTEDHDEARRLVDESPLGCIATVRPTWEGGGFEGEEEARLALFEALAGAARPPLYLDVELAAYEADERFRRRIDALVAPADEPESGRTALILSAHDFDSRPRNLLQRMAAMAEAPACRVIKLAWAGRSLRDNLEAFQILSESPKPTISLCMGRFGLPSRVLAPKYGALLSFAGLEDGQTTAPGQVSVRQMKNVYRWDAIDVETAVYGVIGWPVAHSMSPPIHNAGFDAVSHDGVYLPLPIPAEHEHFKATVGSFLDDTDLDFRGASVTIPHKQNLLKFVKEAGGRVDELADRIGAANTLAVSATGVLYASNTDYAAAIDSVCAALGIDRDDLAGRRVAVLGAGGAARAAVAGFAHYGAEVVVYNRTESKARGLAEQFDGRRGRVTAAPLGELGSRGCGVYINCTPIGMHPDTDATPIETWPEHVGGETVVFDTIYNPLKTRLLDEAERRGAKTVGGLEMFVRQAAAQFELWTGQPAPTDLFEQVMRERL